MNIQQLSDRIEVLERETESEISARLQRNEVIRREAEQAAKTKIIADAGSNPQAYADLVESIRKEMAANVAKEVATQVAAAAQAQAAAAAAGNKPPVPGA